MAKFRSSDQVFDYYTRRWRELGVDDRTAAVRARTGIENDKQFLELRDTDPDRFHQVEEQFKEAQCAPFVDIVSEMHHKLGWKDVGLGKKTGGNVWNTSVGPVATDIIVIKDQSGSDEVRLYDSMGSGGGPQTRPTLNLIEPNPDRTFVIPPGGSGEVETHRYMGGETDTGICDQCGQPKRAEVHMVPEGKKPHLPWKGEDGKGGCDLCTKPLSDPIHTPDPGNGGDTDDSAAITALRSEFESFKSSIEARLSSLESNGHGSDLDLLKKISALEEKISNLVASGNTRGRTIAFFGSHYHETRIPVVDQRTLPKETSNPTE